MATSTRRTRILLALCLVLISPFQIAVAGQDEPSPTKVVIVGAGPCGLFLAATLLQSSKKYKIHNLEKYPRKGKPGNAFGMGLSPRLVKALESLDPELKDRVLTIGQPTNIPLPSSENYPGFIFKIAQRQDICEQMMQYLEDVYGKRDLKVSYKEECESVDFANKKVKTSRGRTLGYDLLVAADGVNSRTRQQLSEATNIQVEHYRNTKRAWKALELPPQSFLAPGTFRRFLHPKFFFQLLPRYPEGHIALTFFPVNEATGEGNNPEGINTAEDLKQAMTEALLEIHVKTQKGKDPLSGFRGLLGIRIQKSLDTEKEDREVVFDKRALQFFVEARAGRSQVMKMDRYHDINASVALIGDAAHGMYSLLGQGCACGLLNARVLGECLEQKDDIATALQAYSDAAVPEAHAITDLNLISHAMEAPMSSKLKFLPSMIWNSFRGKGLMENVGKHDIPFTQLLKENKAIVKVAKKEWAKGARQAVESSSTRTP